MEGNRKYSEKGIASWLGLGGIPILKSREQGVNEIENRWGKYTDDERKNAMVILRSFYKESKAELIKDFGEEFLLGKKP